MVRDPVCGMIIAVQDASATRDFGGARFRFCSPACAAQFDAEPQRFSKASAGTPTPAMVVSNGEAPTGGVLTSALRRPIAYGLLAVLGLLAFYLGIITLAQGWGHAVEQLAEDRWFIGAIALGFGA